MLSRLQSLMGHWTAQPSCELMQRRSALHPGCSSPSSPHCQKQTRRPSGLLSASAALALHACEQMPSAGAAPASGQHHRKSCSCRASRQHQSCIALLPYCSACCRCPVATCWHADLSADADAHADALLCRLLAHFYCVHVTYLTVGTRIGSSAAEKLDLFQAQAINAWRSYPPEAGRSPVACLMAAMNAAGDLLTASQREVVLEELPDAFLKAGVLLRCLAYED